MKTMTFPVRWLMLVLMFLSVTTPALAQGNFPFNDVQELTPEQLKIQKYKLQRLRIQMLRDDWYIIRGINERLDDMTLFKLTGRTTKIEEEQFRVTVGNYVGIGGLVVAAAGGLILTDLIKFQNSPLVGIGLVVVGGAAAIGGQLWAGNISEENPHVIERSDAELMVKEYNEKLKKDLGVDNVPNLE